jgi:hypothetical protein
MKEPYYDKIKEILERFDLPFNENKRTQISFIKNNGDSLTKEEVKEFNKEIKELETLNRNLQTNPKSILQAKKDLIKENLLNKQPEINRFIEEIRKLSIFSIAELQDHNSKLSFKRVELLQKKLYDQFELLEHSKYEDYWSFLFNFKYVAFMLKMNDNKFMYPVIEKLLKPAFIAHNTNIDLIKVFLIYRVNESYKNYIQNYSKLQLALYDKDNLHNQEVQELNGLIVSSVSNEKKEIKQGNSKHYYKGVYVKWDEVTLKYIDFENAIKIKTKSNSYKTILQLTGRKSIFNNHIQFIFQYGEKIEYLSKLKYDTSWSKDLGRINKKIREKIGINSNPIEWDKVNNRFIFHCVIEFVEGQNYKETNFSNIDNFVDVRKDY